MSEQKLNLVKILNDVDAVVNCLKIQTRDIMEKKMPDEMKIAKLAALVEIQGTVLIDAKLELEKIAGRKLNQPVILLEMDTDPCAACIVVSQMHETTLVDDCHGCGLEEQREAFIASETDGSG
jgi:hypothetical protein